MPHSPFPSRTRGGVAADIKALSTILAEFELEEELHGARGDRASRVFPIGDGVRACMGATSVLASGARLERGSGTMLHPKEATS